MGPAVSGRSSMLKESPIAIVGGGLAGLTLSIGLSHNNIPHKIYESALAFSEIGAGIALGPNSVKALELIDSAIGEGFKKCVTYNEGVDADDNGNGTGPRSSEWMDIRIGMKDSFNTLITTVSHKGSKAPGRACFHRAKFLDELIKLIPADTAQFGKSLTAIKGDEGREGNLILHFADGTTTSASAVIACDGIKSRVRQSYILADDPDQPAAHPQFANEYAYRGLYTREQFVSLTQGQLTPGKGTLFCGNDGYIVMYPVEKGRFMNMVAVKRVSPSSGVGGQPFMAPKAGDTNWVQPVDKATMLGDFADWGESIQALLSQIQRPERWALFDHLPAPTYVKGKVVILGDAAHASTPHQGQGAGMAFEDSLILSGVLSKVLGPDPEIPTETRASDSSIDAKIEACFRAYDTVRRPRTQEVCRTSREMGEMIEFTLPGIGRDLTKMKSNLDKRMDWIWDLDLQAEVQRAVDIAEGILRGTEAESI
ncbi:hypothetical protein PV08_08846 [Exophiala spinifera]|uniref:FAD-binding domain-containing protein n=1 Tax=Exophiala spinifera TaxID=91928 RepID=A0A0D2B4N3_9EURO|nr:uncharacterized protein PV08_08846 [Exophiala spinifera]KIW13655.1 hypothetical protein PV08_08846 [Exophiala spinifera]